MRWTTVSAAAVGLAVAMPAAGAPDPYAREDIPMLCSAVDAQVVAGQPRHPLNLYVYEDLLTVWSGASAADSEAVRNQKISRFLNANIARLKCPTPNFDPWNGNILKLGIARQSSDFIDHVIGDWKVDLNYVDGRDGRTVLDYIRYRRTAAGTSTWGTTLNRYYERFRKAGAKHASELPAR